MKVRQQMKRTCLIILIILIFCSLLGCTKGADDISNQESQSESDLVLGVKGGCPTSHPDITYADAFDYFFGYPEWTSFKGTRDEDDTLYDIVQFTGDCLYAGKEVTALIQFTLSDDMKSFEPTYLSFNDVSQTNEDMYALIDKAFSEYQKSQEMEANKTSPAE